MVLVIALGIVGFPSVPHIHGLHTIHKFIKRTTIPAVELELDSFANIFSGSDGSEALQNDQLKTITRLAFNLKDSMPLIFTERVATNFLSNQPDGPS